MSLADRLVVDVCHGRNLELSVLDANALLLIRKGDDFTIVAISEERSAPSARSLLIENT
jgi:hypothetical protein